MCAGVLALVGPPSVAGACYGTWSAGHATAMSQLGGRPPAPSSVANAVGIGAIYASWKVTNRLVVPVFDEGGSLSYNLEKMSQKFGEPLKITSWRDFYRSAGPPMLARTGAVVASFFVAGVAQAVVARSLDFGTADRNNLKP
mmetsp:Transcript_10093/g.24875  ORF Transcript_10093/g.24875 Transcript_10093/m.24875 type:complete len:142 (-) Transcript_10093:20-445(-)